ncbi:aromatic acid exporter family protein, partial [Bacillus pumilus]|uniref:aromatic acid exporter family protein n=1 Tax=Bacillus pumilus TaxID=1408 RepID=UPI0028CBAA05
MKLPPPILKTPIPILLPLYLATSLPFPTPLFPGIPALFPIHPSIYPSFLTILHQVQPNIIPAPLAITFHL